MTSFRMITIHHTGGMYKPNATDLEHYHYLIDGEGKVVKGKHDVQDNLNCKDGNYAQHCGGGNTGNIGIAICAMWNEKTVPIKRIQLESMCKLVAELSKTYGLSVSTKTIMTHAEFGASHPSTTSYGKIDIIKLPCVAVYGTKQVGDWIRSKVSCYRSKI